MASKITTLYISDTSIRMMVTRGRRIHKLADIPLDVDLADVNAKEREAKIVAKIKELFRSRRIKAKKVIIGVSGQQCLSRPLVLPLLPRAMLEEAVVREAKRVLPVPPEQLYISWQVISTTEGKTQAFMIGIPRQISDSVLAILHQLGLKPYLMDVKPLALARLVKEATAIIVDVQPREFDIVIMADGIPQPIRTVPFPQEALALPDKLSIVKDELTRTVQFYNTNKPEQPIRSGVTVYVSGELAGEPELSQSLAGELGYKILPLSSPLKCPKQLDPSQYLVNIGLALKVLPKEAGPLLTNLNTLPASYQPKPLSLAKVIALPATAVAIGMIVLLSLTIQNTAASIDSVHSKIDATNFILGQRQAQKKELSDSIAALQKELANAEATRTVFTAALDGLNSQGEVINGDLQATTSNLVSGLELTNILHSDQVLNISGQAPSEAEVLAYARKLKASDRFSEVTVSSLRQVGDSGGETGAVVSEGGGGGGTVEGVSDNGTAGGGGSNGVMEFTLVLKVKGPE